MKVAKGTEDAGDERLRLRLRNFRRDLIHAAASGMMERRDIEAGAEGAPARKARQLSIVRKAQRLSNATNAPQRIMLGRSSNFIRVREA